ncbi:ABC-F family ATP-binding cassette domain-containing protein [Flaviaesturariibacter aridisoli]|uniref:ABC-F family ATP-binding cassette domain-containing protein n=1 Tax=Flaviaesturariibacter aridisoli TaxID=2545761 RepID=A0A4R4DZA5_9BACT|nr:ATP-binding cassette domain-containing protein [Flaviaesturariibacter aridisoli]TCZ71754.1 ABC-F family ATP-binding cassette domain-containing protein [Flaviaesturariibacter aridisoli]
MLQLQQLTYRHADGTPLFSDLNLSLQAPAKAALVGHNGCGKSTLLRLLAGAEAPSGGSARVDGSHWYVPQHLGSFDGQTVAEVLGAAEKLGALADVLAGRNVEEALVRLDDDWTVAERFRAALDHWGLPGLAPGTLLGALSGGQKTRVFLAGLAFADPKTVLLDEPSNHLDAGGRALLYDWVRSTRSLLLVVSHDRALLNELPLTYELGPQGLTAYGGNYDFYAAQKAGADAALEEDLLHGEKELRKAKAAARAMAERQAKRDARAEKSSGKAGLPSIVINNLRNAAQNSTARAQGVHSGKVDAIRREVDALRAAVPDRDRMKLRFSDSALHRGKTLFVAEDLQYRIDGRPLWAPLTFRIGSGERLAIEGPNGSGKTTLLRLLLGGLEPSGGRLQRSVQRSVYIDQHYSLLDETCTVLEQAQRFNRHALPEHELRTRLDWFLFGAADSGKRCAALSGGERMRLALCCLNIADGAPDLIVLDEPTNNLDLRNTEILAAAVRDYEGTLIVVSHDERFREEVGVAGTINVRRET